MIRRDSAAEYSKHVEKLGNILLGLLSESLGLKSEVLESMECSKEHRLHCHYYPACPEPELAIGTSKHSDAGFLTILLQNQLVSGLQVLYEGRWIDIQPVLGGLVINIGDLLQVYVCVCVCVCLNFISTSKSLGSSIALFWSPTKIFLWCLPILEFIIILFSFIFDNYG